MPDMKQTLHCVGVHGGLLWIQKAPEASKSNEEWWRNLLRHNRVWATKALAVISNPATLCFSSLDSVWVICSSPIYLDEDLCCQMLAPLSSNVLIIRYRSSTFIVCCCLSILEVDE